MQTPIRHCVLWRLILVCIVCTSGLMSGTWIVTPGVLYSRSVCSLICSKKSKTSADWELYLKQRNHVTKLKKASMRVYFYEICTDGPKSKDFWPTIKPFLSKKGSDGGSEVILCEGDKVISDQAEVCTTFNTFFANVAKDIGKDCHIKIWRNIPVFRRSMEIYPQIFKVFHFDL